MRDDSVYLAHILDCLGQIDEYTCSGKKAFMTTRLLQDGVIRNFEIIRAVEQADSSLKTKIESVLATLRT